LEDFERGALGKKIPAIAPVLGAECGSKSFLFFFRLFEGKSAKIIYTTKRHREPAYASCARYSKNRGHFPSDEAATKLIYLALRNITKKWKKSPDHLEAGGKPQFAIRFGERFFAAEAAS